MEDGPNTSLSSENQPETIKNGVVVPIMANFPEGTVVNTKDEIVIEYKKVNGENNAHDESNDFDNLYSSESDALVIDEQAPKKKKIKTKVSRKLKESPARSKVGKKQVLALDTVLENKTSIDNPNEGVSDILKFSEKFSAEVDTNSCDHDNNIEEQTNDSQESENKTLDNTSIFSDSAQLDFHDKDIIPHSNPYFSESLFDLSQQHHYIAEKSPVNINNVYQQIVYQKSETKSSKPTKQFKAKPKAQLKEYAQYLGLQPTVQFKCSKCGKAGFESLNLLQEHLIKCNEVQNKHSRSSDNENSCSGFKLTRKVFLCSACGTYYENWNLYMHMLEFHRRYICLYCLGMFSILEDLYQHIQSRHNLEPGRKNTLDEFFNTYNEPCCLVCCECNKLFSEQDNFFYHNCSKTITKNKQKPPKQLIRPENHVTGESIDLEVSPIEMDKDKLCNQEITDSTPTENNQIDIVADITSDNKSETMTNTRDSQVNSSNNNNPDNDNSNIENLKQYLSNSENQEDLTDQTANDKNECDVNESIIEDSKNTNNCEEMAEDEELSEQPENALEENEEEIAVNNSNTTAEDSMEAEENKDTTAEDREESADEVVEEEVETRRVPKLSLKLPKLDLYSADAEDSDESDKAAMDVEHIESENEMESQELDEPINENKEEHSGIQVADTNIAITELELDQPLDKIDVRILLRKCLVATSPTCIYCNHSRKIAVNGKQLGLHAIAEHRYSAIVNSITAEELIPESFVSRIKDSLNDLESVFFNLESSASEEAVTFSHVFECFQCYYSTTVHKELYLHNRKFHSKNLLLCIMCKSNFYSYSELICHLCPGVYILDYELTFRCCMCVSDDLPSSFRLMVHLRKRHNVCDVCLEMCHNQYKLSNHVWKHKLHHFCYRCGIAYRNKPDITRHLFWKHGTQSVLCKKCLQKKWPHVYHFCVPPATFTCEECNLILTKAVSLKVHKRLHTDEKIHACTFEDCTERFISKKLMLKHEQRHREPPPEEEEEEEVEPEKTCEEEENIKEEPILDEKKSEETKQEDEDVKPKTKVDVYDLPELNLSESDSSDSESESTELKPKIEDSTILESVDPEKIEDIIQENADLSTKVEEESSSISVEKVTGSEMDTNPPRAIDENLLTVVEQEIGAENSSTMIQNIWDNFKTYQANKEKLDHLFTTDVDKTTESNNDTVSDEIVTKVALEETKAEEEEELTWEKALMDHDYCLLTEVKKDTTMIEVKPDLTMTERVDHDYCFHSDKDKDSEQDKSKDLKDNPIQGGVIAEKPSLEKVEDKSFNESIQKQPKKNSGSSSSSSSDSDSSSCSCGSNCSCSSSSGNSSSSSDSSESDSSSEEGRRKQQARRQKRRQKRLTKQDKKSVPIKHEAPKPPPEIIDVVATETKPENKKALPKAETPIRESDLETTESETDEEFYDRTPLKMAKKLMEEKRAQLLAEMGPNSVPNGSFIESTSRPPTPPAGTVEEEIEPKRHVTRKKKTKKRKKRKTEKKQAVREYTATLIDVPIPPYYQQFHSTPPTVAPITLSLSRNSPIPSATIAPSSPILQSNTEMVQEKHTDSMSSTDSYLRASKRRRIPNKFYGYSSDEENDKTTPAAKIRKLEVVPPTPRSPMIVPPITIKPLPPRPATPTVEPISIRLPKTHPGDFRVKQRKEFVPPIRVVPPRPPAQIEADSATESNESDTEEATAEAAPEPPPPVFRPNQPQLYCYCRCPYDEVSEMIGCDSEDCEIEWFHFECVGIMVPPKGQWFCPDCRKKKQQQRREILQA